MALCERACGCCHVDLFYKAKEAAHSDGFCFSFKPHHGFSSSQAARRTELPKPWQVYRRKPAQRSAPERKLFRASLSSNGLDDSDGNKAGINADQGETPGGDLGSERTEFASDSTGVFNFQRPNVAMVDEESIGASRFDVAVRAMKGDFDPPSPSKDTERGSILGALIQFPSTYTFSVVGKVETATKTSGHAFVRDCLETVERICGTKLATDQYSVKEKAGGKYQSMRITTLVQSADIVKATYDELLKDPRVIMAY